MDIQKNVSLKPYNTFGVDAVARQLVHIKKEEDLSHLYAAEILTRDNLLLLGGGSNILFVNDFEGLVIHMAIGGIDYCINGTDVVVRAGGGVVWNDLVNYCVNKGFGGIENLSLIPGTVGAAPVQNIGAYGVELQDIFLSCRGFDLATGEIKTFYKEDCAFDYRDSIFKGVLKGKIIITEVNLSLSTESKLNTTYGAISAELHNRGIVSPTIKEVSEVVSAIRVSKLPDPSMIGNSGSFFKNPVISVDRFRVLLSNFVDIVSYPFGDNKIKLAAGWLIEQCGWKGRVVGNTGTWKNQALVLVNHGNATGLEVYDFSEEIIKSVKNKFDVVLEREVNVVL
ncbi:UDP-N-acetylmuramate dehydrogenase [Olivibacter sp. SDN3]|uniref:UDP-N-acetylmuramate dehydrogenase n=1 Tax=Olivibacter sp. SDN3 TaxID=2764720 RepID=UPI0016516A2F|nr:UDP-N-acetylmuramate dehydrogenase [Olivibacter sp. SDN3]QNL51486.1 UDP-N-acetylmuramate dehydrogenase [Olivibacter sp. SDN3]